MQAPRQGELEVEWTLTKLSSQI